LRSTSWHGELSVRLSRPQPRPSSKLPRERPAEARGRGEHSRSGREPDPHLEWARDENATHRGRETGDDAYVDVERSLERE
jgi:hypothetical protein